MPTRVVIMGAAGRDFHNFNTVFRDDNRYDVVAFTATQIPDIAGRIYPAELAGPRYPNGIQIVEETELASLVREKEVGLVVFAYSDVTHEHVMHRASLAMAHGANFMMVGSRASMLVSKRPVVSVCAVRTGCGKSPTSQKVARLLRDRGLKVVVVRHPMPYGDLRRQICQRFATMEDLALHQCTIEEMEEYEPHIQKGIVVYAGIDYQKVLSEAEKEADVLVWDGGNNDMPFFRPDLDIVVTDPHRPNHELQYFPGEANFLRAGVLLITKMDSAEANKLAVLERNIAKHNPKATVVKANLAIYVEEARKIQGKRVLVVEDGPTLTHGDMTFGAGVLAAKKYGAAEQVDPRPFAVGKIVEMYKQYSTIRGLLPAFGYSGQQVRDLEETINRTPCDTVLIATPVDLRRICDIKHDTCRITYELEEISKPDVSELLSTMLRERQLG